MGITRSNSFYTNKEFLISALNEDVLKTLTDDEGIIDDINQAVIDTVLIRATGLIDMHIRGVVDDVEIYKYEYEYDDLGEIIGVLRFPDGALEHICVDIALYYLTVRRLGSLRTAEMGDKIERNFRRALDLLNKIALGEMILEGQLGVMDSFGDEALFNYDRRVASRSELDRRGIQGNVDIRSDIL